MLVSPAKEWITPASSAALSSRRKLVVPTAMIRPPFARTALSRAAVSGSIRPHSACHRMVCGILGLDRQERTRTDMQRQRLMPDARLGQRGHQLRR